MDIRFGEALALDLGLALDLVLTFLVLVVRDGEPPTRFQVHDF